MANSKRLLLTIAFQYSVFISKSILSTNAYIVVPIVHGCTTTKHTRWMERHSKELPRMKRQRQQHHSMKNNDENDAILNQAHSNGEIVEPDLFDYFDPLLSPHAYPKGIGASTGTTVGTKIRSLVRYDDDESEEELMRSDDVTANPSLSLPGDDLGWGIGTNRTAPPKKKSYQLKKPFGISLPGSDDDDDDDDDDDVDKLAIKSKTTSLPTIGSGQLDIDTSTIFDPTLSPHFYTKGSVPDVIIGDQAITIDSIGDDNDGTSRHNEVVTIGILLMDHGSRNSASNERLHELAKLYQQQFTSVRTTSLQNRNQKNVRVIVKAAHMEIALPSIEDGLSALIQENVQEIICHPYFLSPGRHVVEDIPQLVNAAIQTLSITIPVKTTRPIGSETDIMIRAINTLVQETSEHLERK